jgi:very-short-patch-repair endonuclease
MWLDITTLYIMPSAHIERTTRDSRRDTKVAGSQIDQMRKDAAKEDYLRTVGIRLLRIPNAMVLEHPDEFVREVVEAIRASVEKARK